MTNVLKLQDRRRLARIVETWKENKLAKTKHSRYCSEKAIRVRNELASKLNIERYEKAIKEIEEQKKAIVKEFLTALIKETKKQYSEKHIRSLDNFDLTEGIDYNFKEFCDYLCTIEDQLNREETIPIYNLLIQKVELANTREEVRELFIKHGVITE
jgi:hypothetical protein